MPISSEKIMWKLSIQTSESRLLREKKRESFLDRGGRRISGITEDAKFYVNEAGNPVIAFERYEIAPGSSGEIEFEIQP